MGDWSYLSALLDKVQSHSTVIGKIWMSVLFLFRILVLGVAADSVWGDEKSEFLCNNNHPGCRNKCYDRMFPISHVRFWVLQILFVSTPTLVYLGHAIHVIHKEKKLRERLLLQQGGGGGDRTDGVLLKRPKYTDERGKVRIKGTLLRSYLAQLFAKIALEVLFVAGQYYLYGFVMDVYFECPKEICPRVGAECYMSRPTEKTIFILFMLVVACLSLLLNVLEVFYLLCRRCRSASKKRSEPHPPHYSAYPQLVSTEQPPPPSLDQPLWGANPARHPADHSAPQRLVDICSDDSCIDLVKEKHT
ncbi:gap junction Cx32.2 protein [Aplochiton taeniatus]